MDAEQVFADDQLDSYAGSRGRRLGVFYKRAREGGAPAVVAGFGALIDLVGYHWPGETSDG